MAAEERSPQATEGTPNRSFSISQNAPFTKFNQHFHDEEHQTWPKTNPIATHKTEKRNPKLYLRSLASFGSTVSTTTTGGTSADVSDKNVTFDRPSRRRGSLAS